jgi:malonyl-ACP decarboxylase
VSDRAVGRVVVTGLGVICAVAHNLADLAEALRRGDTGIALLQDPGEPGYGAPIRGFALPEALARIPGLAGALRDRAARAAARAPLPVRAATVVALQAWQHARLHDHALPPGRLGIVVGGSNLTEAYAESQRARYARDPAFLPASFALRCLDTDHVGVVSEVLGVTGEGWTVGGASASGNLAIIQAARLIRDGGADACLAIGALAELGPLQRRGYLNAGAMAAREGGSPAPPFDQDRRGFVPGQGCACLVLESAGSARRRGAAPLAELAGDHVALAANRLADPGKASEAEVMSAALRRAGLGPDQVDYVNAHGSGSPLGDAVEAAALDQVFGGVREPPWANSTKSLVGHCLTAAGAVEAAATIVQLDGGFVHPNAGLRRPLDTRCRLAGPSARPARLAVAVSNSFGFGGLHTSIVLTKTAS